MLKNYTSQVPASRSIAYIESVLALHKATQIIKQYSVSGYVKSIAFSMMVNGVPVHFMLPAQVGNCYMVLRGQIRRYRPDMEKRLLEQAERTAWKIVSDWTDAQMAMIDLAQVELTEVFLPYVYDPKHDRTLYQVVKQFGVNDLFPALPEKVEK
ncbi:MAG TPA: hypothetical protein PKB02_02520 [Anaerohalosphaeraceae bacterium]|nr:hypothetical protein [Anaerohalosphaeraceae bacterium]